MRCTDPIDKILSGKFRLVETNTFSRDIIYKTSLYIFVLTVPLKFCILV